ncbi:MAG TPA: hypothetical protein PKW90_18465 [Myxococcota bacterium]|nr:hypothetical protein [Myxococcota bacterium]
MRPVIPAALVAILVGTMGCGGPTPDSSGDSSADSLGRDSVPPAEFCAETCASPSVGGCFTTEACTAECLARVGDWPTELQGAFASCVAENPLCYETLDGCMLNQLHPTGSTHPLQLQGSGLHSQEGLVIHVWHDPDLPVQFGGEAVITGGAFSFAWEEAVYVSDTTTSLLLFFIDVDGDQRCTPAADLTGTASPAWNGDFLNPSFSASVAPPLSDPDFVCDFLP